MSSKGPGVMSPRSRKLKAFWVEMVFSEMKRKMMFFFFALLQMGYNGLDLILILYAFINSFIYSLYLSLFKLKNKFFFSQITAVLVRLIFLQRTGHFPLVTKRYFHPDSSSVLLTFGHKRRGKDGDQSTGAQRRGRRGRPSIPAFPLESALIESNGY